MVTELNANGRKRAASLFDGWKDTMIWSCLEGEMGKAYAVLQYGKEERKSGREDPFIASAKLDIADFCFTGKMSMKQASRYWFPRMRDGSF